MTNSYLQVTYDKNDICTILLNRPENHNAFDDQFIAEFISVLTTIQQAPNVKLVVIKANGKNFSAGADLHWMKKMAQYSEKENFVDAMQLAKLMQMLYELNKPTIVIAEGQTFGGGLGLIACCDIAIAETEASFCFSEVKLGLIPAVISPYVINAIGQRQAQRYFLTAESFNAEEAQRIGLIHLIANHDQLTLEVEKICKKLLMNSPQAMLAAKKLIQKVSYTPLDEHLMEMTANKIAAIRASEEAQEGLQAFLEKRKPQWIKG